MRKHVVALVLCLSSTAASGISPDDRCHAEKLKRAGLYGACRLRAESKAVKTFSTPDFGKCDSKFNEKWGSAETKAAGLCPTNGDAGSVQTFITQHADDLAAALAGGSLPNCSGDLATCSSDLTACNSSLSACNANLTATNANLVTCNSSLTSCNGNLSTCNTDLGTCQSDLAACQATPQGQRLKTNQTTCYNAGGSAIACAGTGQDGELQKGLARQYTDNNDGTITDDRTGLVWEKKSDDGSIHDWDTTYTWADAFSTFIATLNSGGGFAGHNDWRLPNRSELESLTDLGRMNPAIDPVFDTGCSPGCTVTTCSCTSVFLHYWTSTTNFWSTSTAWLVYFVDGDVNAFDKTSIYLVRAVRGGL